MQVTEDTDTLTFAPVLLTAEAETVPTLTISEASATWSTGSWSSGSAPTSGEAVISATTDATLTIDAAVSLSSLTFEVTQGKTLTIELGTNGSLAVTTTTKVTSGKVIAPKGTYKVLTVNDGATFLAADSGVSADSVESDGTVGVVGAGSWGSTSSTPGSVGAETMASRFVLRTGTFRKEGEGTFHVGFYKRPSATDQHIEVAGGTLEFYVHGGTAGTDDHTFQTLTVEKDCTFSAATKWAMKITVAEALRGEGAVTLTQTAYQNAARKLQLDGAADEYTGVMTLTGTALTIGEAFGGTFGGALSISSGTGNRVATMTVARSTGIAIAKDLTVGSGVPVDLSAGGNLSVGGNLSLGSGAAIDLSAGGNLSVGGTLTLGGNNVFTLSESAKAGDVLIKLTGEGAQANAATAEQLSVSTPGLFVAAQGANYVLAASPELSLSADGVWSTAKWTSGGSPLAEAPTSGGAKVMTTADATLTIDAAVSLDSIIFEVDAGKTLTVAFASGGSFTATQTVVNSGKVIVQGGTYGTVTLAEDATLLFAGSGSKQSFGYFTAINPGGTAGVTVEKGQTLTLTCTTGTDNSGKVYDGSRLLLRTGTLRKEGEGAATLQTYNVTEADNQSIEVAGGTLTIYEEGGLGDYGYPAHTFQNVAIDAGCTLASTAKWGTHIAVAGALRGEGAFTFSEDTQKEEKPRNCELLGTFADFTGTLTCNATSLIFGAESTGDFGGNASVTRSTNYKKEVFQIARATDLLVKGNLSLGAGVTLDLAAGGLQQVGGSFTLGGTVPVTLPASATDGLALVTLTGAEAAADDATAAKFSVPSGYYVEAKEKAYVLRKVTLPGVQPSEPGAGDEEGYSTEAAAALTAAAEEALIAGVSQVLLQTKGAASGSVPTVTEVNNVLGCFEGVVEANAEAQTLTIRYEFGVADIAADDSVSPWNGKWQVTAKVEGPIGAAFAEGVTVAAYEVDEDGQIPDGAAPLATETIAAGTPVSAVTLKGITLTGLGTHGVRVRVKATK